MGWRWLPGVLGVVCLLPGIASGHAAIDLQVARLSERIAARPADGRLYLKRGDLYRGHRQWERALADFARAAALDPDLDADWYRGRTLLEKGDAAAALPVLKAFLARSPEHARARITLARSLAATDKPLEAARAYDRALALIGPPARPRPDWYLERARALAAAGRTHIGEAVRGLDQGHERLGAIVLTLEALELEVASGRYDQALARLRAIAAGARRKERWSARRGEILAAAGRPEEARAAYKEALDQMQEVPAARRTRRYQELRERVRAALARLERKVEQEGMRP